MGYVRTDTEVYINTYQKRISRRTWWCNSGKNKSVGTLGKNRQIGTSYIVYVLDLSKFEEIHRNIKKEI